MSKTAVKSKNRSGRFTLGREAFTKISAVEGIHLSPEMERDFREFDRKGLTAAERRKAISRKYGKARI